MNQDLKENTKWCKLTDNQLLILFLIQQEEHLTPLEKWKHLTFLKAESYESSGYRPRKESRHNPYRKRKSSKHFRVHVRVWVCKSCVLKRRGNFQKKRCPSFLCLQLITYTPKMKTTLEKMIFTRWWWQWWRTNDCFCPYDSQSFFSFPLPPLILRKKVAFDHRHYLCNSIHTLPNL